MNYGEVEKLLESFENLSILVVGDLMLDEYLWGRSDRISPEAPVPIVNITGEDLRLGGAGNVANNLLSLGCRVRVASVLGEDADGRRLQELLQARRIEVDGLVWDSGRTTSRKSRILASNQQMLRIDREVCTPISAADEERLLAKVRQMLPDVQGILLSDYLKGVLTEKVVQEIIALGLAAALPVVIDPKGTDYRKYRGATLLTPNRKETQLASGIPMVDESSLRRAGRQLFDELELEALVVTRSEEGMTLFLPNGQEEHFPTLAREVFDVSGAGDTVLASLGACLAAGVSVNQAARLSNLAAGIVVGKVGTSTVSPEEILEELSHQHKDSDLKIRSAASVKRLLESERQKGRAIVFTNGCFDLLHVGHVKYLQKARRLGDLLVLGLNSDASIRRLKGPKRPLIDQDERAHILAALDCIDYVVIFDEDTPLELIREVRPHILVKGGDYQADQVVGKDVVESYGGRVELITFVDGKSTTNIVEKILQAYQD
ncbi:bifunctional D-glycero-beta-D-manno-heptose-7-phosphate kinase/D-glycero-beta-D-manno-heptose 1-phosphate adenylyltransferase HldE [Desulfuromonas sp. KJ2020]|uniref:bifunctional D-glycero-beta-D-manno-heptose-7-phosphate kinase/D-glycero-beta-D-manno-heptose 1-phosphate adenylyltransferase HldE n=1 Tax=Desulfuromonas sp. KJ2020 TaxID=2919173 RepID=UPI0020A7B8EE|nr:bifunctional D-glycero-beta-D-manno-heptose-7-phosphate kinase/D-glycero-beta-D-manno-heptose 1-phosphate adenylyltransferase HldE [Desulfuromonas sp. KJ2020]MCP3177567.1 bifunctional D-glycero-beta-D-manno-heptose-7-phosphate kinase/D-glycero-beta-D-manno-heptose 1-phosphate adenylyltransferase HldE [Desulfuromonas sp. KJ2020]